MGLSTETLEAMKAGVAPIKMQQGYDREQERLRQQQQVPGTGYGGVTIMSPQQRAMSEAQIRAGIAAQKAEPTYAQKMEAAMAKDAERQRLNAIYQANQPQVSAQAVQAKPAGMFQSLQNWYNK